MTSILTRGALPVALRHRLSLGVGAQLEVLEEANGLRLRVLRPVAMSDLSELAGMVKAPSRGEARRLEDFDPALDWKSVVGGLHE